MCFSFLGSEKVGCFLCFVMSFCCYVFCDVKMEGVCGLSGVNCRAKGGAPGFKVAILGAAGGIGQPLAMLTKMNPLVSVLHLYDIVNTPGVTADISHMDTGAVVSYPDQLLEFKLWLKFRAFKYIRISKIGVI